MISVTGITVAITTFTLLMSLFSFDVSLFLPFFAIVFALSSSLVSLFLPLELRLLSFALLLFALLLNNSAFFFLDGCFFLSQFFPYSFTFCPSCLCVGGVFLLSLRTSNFFGLCHLFADICPSALANALLDCAVVDQLAYDFFCLLIYP